MSDSLPNTIANQDKQSEDILENLRNAYTSIKQLENSISHRKIIFNIEKKLHEANKKTSLNDRES